MHLLCEVGSQVQRDGEIEPGHPEPESKDYVEVGHLGVSSCTRGLWSVSTAKCFPGDKLKISLKPR